MTDGVAMLTRAKENLMFTMAALSDKQRIALSQSKHEFIEMCSFNGKECDIDQSVRSSFSSHKLLLAEISVCMLTRSLATVSHSTTT